MSRAIYAGVPGRPRSGGCPLAGALAVRGELAVPALPDLPQAPPARSSQRARGPTRRGSGPMSSNAMTYGTRGFVWVPWRDRWELGSSDISAVRFVEVWWPPLVGVGTTEEAVPVPDRCGAARTSARLPPGAPSCPSVTRPTAFGAGAASAEEESRFRVCAKRVPSPEESSAPHLREWCPSPRRSPPCPCHLRWPRRPEARRRCERACSLPSADAHARHEGFSLPLLPA